MPAFREGGIVHPIKQRGLGGDREVAPEAYERKGIPHVTSQDIRLSSLSPTAAPAAAPSAAAASSTPAATPQDRATLSGKAEPAPGYPRLRRVKTLPADVAEPGKPAYVPGQVIVKFKSGVGASDVNALAESFGFTTVRHFDIPPAMVEKFGGELYQFRLRNGDTVEKAIERLSGQADVAYAEPNYKIQLDDPQPTKWDAAGTPGKAADPDVPNDLDPRLWGINNTGQDGGKAGEDVGAAAAWHTEKGKPASQGGPLIAVIDTGLDYTHPDLAANVWTNPHEIPGNGKDDDNDGIIDDVHGANIIKKDGNPMDDNEHGTHVSGTIGAVGNNRQGIVGVNWNASIAGVKFLDANGSGSYADAVDAVLYATRIGARVTSNSWGGGGFSQALYDAFKASPALHIAAAGNEGANSDTTPSYPGGFDLPNIVSVAAMDRNGHLADFSNYGAKSVDVAAPGVDVYSLKPGNSYQTMSGTSMATPHVTGVTGLILSHDPSLTNEQVKARLINTAIKQPEFAGKMVSGGRVSAANALIDDRTPPATPSDFHIAQAGATGMTLGWTEVGDDGLQGKASAYEIRYSDKPIAADGSNWDQALPAGGYGIPSDPGTAETARVAISPDDSAKHYFFGLKVYDKLGNASGLVTAEGDSLAAAVAFKDDMEADNNNWTADKPWGKVTDAAQGKVYTDSPNGAYDSNANTSLTSKAIDLSTVQNPRLIFKEKHDTEANYDFAHVEVTADGGKTWSEVAKYDGTNDWTERNLDLGAYAGKTVQVRFRMTSDSSINKDGIYVDDVKIAGDPK